MDQNFRELQQWLVETSEEPLETMAWDFLTPCIGDYEAHMAPWQAALSVDGRAASRGIESLLDIGCGSGLELDAIFQRFQTLAVTGIDLSPAMLAKLRQKHGDKALTLRQADYFQCALGGQCFDAVVAFETLHHFTLAQKTALFQKLYHTLKPGESFWNATISPRPRLSKNWPLRNAPADGSAMAWESRSLSILIHRSP